LGVFTAAWGEGLGVKKKISYICLSIFIGNFMLFRHKKSLLFILLFLSIQSLFAQNEPLILWDWSVDMSACPTNFMGVRTTETAKGANRNYRYFWAKILEKDPNALDLNNLKAFTKLGDAPEITDELIEHLRKTKNIDLSPYKGQVLDHHHWEQGNLAVAIPQGDHQKFSKTLHTFRKPKPNSNGKILRVVAWLGLLHEFVALQTADPHSFLRMYGKAKPHEIYFSVEKDAYFEIVHIETAYDAEGNEEIGFLEYNYYSDYQWDTKQGKYVGFGFIGRTSETCWIKKGICLTGNFLKG
jgi:HNH/Endo VII superfamily nuclease toxin with a HHH motif